MTSKWRNTSFDLFFKDVEVWQSRIMNSKYRLVSKVWASLLGDWSLGVVFTMTSKYRLVDFLRFSKKDGKDQETI